MIFGSYLVDNNHCHGVMSEMPLKGAYAIVAGNYKKNTHLYSFPSDKTFVEVKQIKLIRQ